MRTEQLDYLKRKIDYVCPSPSNSMHHSVPHRKQLQWLIHNYVSRKSDTQILGIGHEAAQFLTCCRQYSLSTNSVLLCRKSQLIQSVENSLAGARVLHVQPTDFLAPPVFDIIFLGTSSSHLFDDRRHEILSYLRMLLRPGAYCIFFSNGASTSVIRRAFGSAGYHPVKLKRFLYFPGKLFIARRPDFTG